MRKRTQRRPPGALGLLRGPPDRRHPQAQRATDPEPVPLHRPVRGPHVKDPAIVLLDEPTSALDAGSEVAVLSAIERLLEGRTSLTIAHRMATIRQADRIVVAAGRVVDHGTHGELFERCALYQTYCRQQSVA